MTIQEQNWLRKLHWLKWWRSWKQSTPLFRNLWKFISALLRSDRNNVVWTWIERRRPNVKWKRMIQCKKETLRHVCVVPCIWSPLNQNHSSSTSSSLMHAWILITSKHFQSQQIFIKTYKKCWIGSLSFQRKANILALSSLRMFPGIISNVTWIV